MCAGHIPTTVHLSLSLKLKKKTDALRGCAIYSFGPKIVVQVTVSEANSSSSTICLLRCLEMFLCVCGGGGVEIL